MKKRVYKTGGSVGALSRAAEKVRAAGMDTDTELVHLNPRELARIEKIFGRRPTKNPRTGLPQFDDGGDGGGDSGGDSGDSGDSGDGGDAGDSGDSGTAGNNSGDDSAADAGSEGSATGPDSPGSTDDGGGGFTAADNESGAAADAAGVGTGPGNTGGGWDAVDAEQGAAFSGPSTDQNSGLEADLGSMAQQGLVTSPVSFSQDPLGYVENMLSNINTANLGLGLLGAAVPGIGMISSLNNISSLLGGPTVASMTGAPTIGGLLGIDQNVSSQVEAPTGPFAPGADNTPSAPDTGPSASGAGLETAGVPGNEALPLTLAQMNPGAIMPSNPHPLLAPTSSTGLTGPAGRTLNAPNLTPQQWQTVAQQPELLYYANNPGFAKGGQVKNSRKGALEAANLLRNKSRSGETVLAHVRPDEMRAVAKMAGRNPTINPDTGLPELGILSDILSVGVPIASSIFAPGISDSVASGISSFLPDAAASTIKDISPFLVGAAEGAGTSALTGGKAGIGALEGLGGTLAAPTIAGGIDKLFPSAGLTTSNLPSFLNLFGGAPSTGDLVSPGDNGVTVSGGPSTGTPVVASTPLGSGSASPQTYDALSKAVGPTAAAAASPAAKKGLSTTSLGLAALAALGSAMAKPKQAPQAGPASTAATQGPIFNAPLTPTTLGRSYTPPTGLKPSDWYTYGQLPEVNFYQGNSLGFSGGGEVTDGYVNGGHPEGDGMSDDINAKLSGGEFVINAPIVSAIGNGSNEAGARKLEKMRDAIARDAGLKSKTPPRLRKSPLDYLREAH